MLEFPRLGTIRKDNPKFLAARRRTCGSSGCSGPGPHRGEPEITSPQEIHRLRAATHGRHDDQQVACLSCDGLSGTIRTVINGGIIPRPMAFANLQGGP